MLVVEQVLEAEGAGDRQVVGFGKRCDVGAGLGGPGAAAQQQQRLLAPRPAARAARAMICGAGVRLRPGGSGAVSAHLGLAGQHVFGQGQHHRAGAAAGGDLEGAAMYSGMRSARSICATHLAIWPYMRR